MTTELMITGCVTVKDQAVWPEIVEELESLLRQYGTHCVIDIPDSRDRSPNRDKRGHFR